jgi:hypothetical protein
MHPYERWILRRYLANALRASRFARPPSRDKDIVTWIESHARLLGLPDLAPDVHSTRRSRGLDRPIDPASWRAFRGAIIAAPREPAPSSSPLQRRLRWLAEACCLTEAQSSVLGLLARASQVPQVSALVEAVNERLRPKSRFGWSLRFVDHDDRPSRAAVGLARSPRWSRRRTGRRSRRARQAS